MTASLLAFGIPGAKELIVIAIVAFAFYGRAGLLRATPQGRAIAPWVKLLSPVARRPSQTNRRTEPLKPDPPMRFRDRLRHDRWFWAFALTAAAGVAAWVVTRVLIQSGAAGS